MKRSITIAGLIALTVLAVLASDPANEVAALEHNWAEAQKAGDAAPVAEMLADNFMNTDVDGHTYGRDKVLSNMKGGHWEENKISDVKVSVYGNAAVASGSWVGKGVEGDGAKIDRQERWTEPWIKMPNGKWQCVASHQSAVK